MEAMGDGNETGGVRPGDQEFQFKGYPQPPVNERLEQSYNFLSDEDGHRCLNFDTKISQIEAFVAHVEKENLPHDPDLLKDVKVMLKTHRSWEKSVNDTPPDMCCNGPRMRPFSTRLMNRDVVTGFKQGLEDIGLITQMRDDHAPFTVDRQDGHVNFLRELQRDAGVDPDLPDPATNLYWKESQAYDWALEEPSLIPYWMHSNRGIPKVSIDGEGAPWYNDHSILPATTKERPARGWVPSYLLEVERRINSLLEDAWAKDDSIYQELIQMLRFVEPSNIGQLREKWEAFCLAETLSEGLKKAGEAAKTEYRNAEGLWLTSCAEFGVYFILEKRDQVKAPHLLGIFYISDPIMSEEQHNTLAVANQILSAWLTRGREGMAEKENDELDGFLRYSLTPDIQILMNECFAIMEKAGVNDVDELADEEKETWNHLQTRLIVEQLAWEEDLKERVSANKAKLEFRYIRPGEMKDGSGNILYLPWELSSLAHFSPAKDRKDLEVPPEAEKLRDRINERLLLDRLVGLDDETEVEQKHVRGLLQVIYPELAAMLSPYFQLLQKRRQESLTPGNGGLSDAEQSWLSILEPEVKRAWELWYGGLGNQIRIKVLQTAQEPENPSRIYHRPLPDNNETEEASQDESGHALEITRELASEEISNEFFSKIIDLLVNYQYPALRKLYIDFFKAAGEPVPLHPDDIQKAQLLQSEWGLKFQRWVNSKRGRMITIKKPIPYLDPDDDPSVVYFRGPKDNFLYNYLPLTSEVKEYLKTMLDLDLPQDGNIDGEMWANLPRVIQDSFTQYYNTGSPAHRTVLEWHLENWFAKSEDILESPSSQITNPKSSSIDISQWTIDMSPDILTPIRTELVTPSNPRTRTPGFRTDYIDPVLKVNLDLMGKEVAAVQLEINRLLSQIKAGEAPHYPRNSEDLTRLVDLLEQFTPTDIQQSKDRALSLVGQISLPPSPSKPALWDGRDFHAQASLYGDQFLDWIQSLLKSKGIVVKLSDTTCTLTGHRLLVFNSEITGTGGDFTVTTPDTSHGRPADQVPLIKSKISLPTPVSPITRDLYRQHKDSIKSSENTINILLDKYIQEGRRLNWHDRELLLSYLRRLMPPDLQRLDSEVREIDNKARDTMQSLTADEKLLWSDSWFNFNNEFHKWVESLPPSGITIARKEGLNEYEGILELQVSSWEENLPPRQEGHLPSPVSELLASLNRIIFGIDALDGKAIVMIDTLLRSHHRPVATFIRQHLNALLGNTICRPLQKNPEDVILVEASLTQEFFVWVRDLIETPNTKLEVEEVTPAAFSTFIAIDGVRESKDEKAVEKKADEAWGRISPSFLHLSRKDFHDTVIKMRQGTLMNDEEYYRIRELLQPISEDEYLAMIDKVYRLSRKDLEKLSEAEIAEWRNVDTAWLWYHLARRYPKYRKLVDVYPEAEPFNFLGTKITGDGIPLEPSKLPPPNRFQIQEVEVELNNLLYRDSNGKLEEAQKKELEYLLTALLLGDVVDIQKKVEELEKRHLASLGASFAVGMALTQARSAVERAFDGFRAGFDARAYPIFLDTYHYSKESIARAVQLAKTWKEEVRVPGGGESFPSTGIKFQNPELREVHELYGHLKKWVESGCEDNEGVEQMLLVQLWPRNLVRLKDQIFHHEAHKLDLSAAEVHKFPEREFQLHVLQDQLIHIYMNWYLKLSLKERERMKKQVKNTGLGKMNYTRMAERRGITRAAIELGLNMLATNQEQHRPHDRFREIDLPGEEYEPPQPDVPLTLPLDATKRPLEQEPFEYTNKMNAYRQWKDFDYEIVRMRKEESSDDLLSPPYNFNGPIVAADVVDVKAAANKKANRLLQVAGMLTEAEARYPRPLMQQLLLRFHEGFVENLDQPDSMYWDTVPLTRNDIETLLELTQVSWDELSKEYNEKTLGRDLAEGDISRLEEFEMQIQKTFRFGRFANGPREYGKLPFWTPPEDSLRDLGTGKFEQIRYDSSIASTQGLSLAEVQKAVGDSLVGSNCTPWNSDEVRQHLRDMHTTNRIHFNERQDRVSIIPYSGHPENKYVTTRDQNDLEASAGVKRKGGEFSVQYNKDGKVGVPIFQPHKYYHLQALAFRIGRDAQRTMVQSTDSDKSQEECTYPQLDAHQTITNEMSNITHDDRVGAGGTAPRKDPKKITLKKIAQDLLKITPELAIDAFPNNDPMDLTDAESAAVIQNQMLQELNNSWELKFPVHERVWDFATPRIQATTKHLNNGKSIGVRPRRTQFFHMRRFPVECQTEATQTIIRESGPTVLEKEKVAKKRAMTQEEKRKMRDEAKRYRYFEGRAWFPFGETPYQAAYQSHRMEMELADVPQFQKNSRKPKPGLLTRITKPFWGRGSGQRGGGDGGDEPPPVPSRSPSPELTTDLPPLPRGFKATNISLPRKHYQISRVVRKLPTFPDENILEYYHTPEEIRWLKEREKAMELNRRIEIEIGKRLGEASFEEVEEAREKLGVGVEEWIGERVEGRDGRKKWEREGEEEETDEEDVREAERESWTNSLLREGRESPMMSGALLTPVSGGNRTRKRDGLDDDDYFVRDKVAKKQKKEGVEVTVRRSNEEIEVKEDDIDNILRKRGRVPPTPPSTGRSRGGKWRRATVESEDEEGVELQEAEMVRRRLWGTDSDEGS